ncbi:hypothetical protein [Streptomyces sp. NPDC001546]|uniref:hypothetical protein n=1 Tax=Streptomyces sp. NPDC001546 TaxID=3364585 RepID=UPI00369066C4
MGNRQADIDFTFQRPTTVRGLLEVLTPADWAAEENLGRISYMINEADDMYEWYDSAPDRLDAVLTELDATVNLPYTVALNIYHSQGGTGGMLMLSAQRKEVSFLPTGFVYENGQQMLTTSGGIEGGSCSIVSSHAQAQSV